jgi:hypothetical protein
MPIQSSDQEVNMAPTDEKQVAPSVDWFKRITDVITAIVLIAGFAFTISQIWRLQESTDLAAWNAVSQQWLEVDKLLIQNPEARKYMYSDIPAPADGPASDRVKATGLYVLDFVDNAISTSNYIITKYPHAYSVIHPKEWENYFRATFFRSLVICTILIEMPEGFNPETRRIGEDACRKSQHSSATVPRGPEGR